MDAKLINPDLNSEINDIVSSEIWGYRLEPSEKSPGKWDLGFIIGQEVATSFEYETEDQARQDLAIVCSLNKDLVDINE